MINIDIKDILQSAVDFVGEKLDAMSPNPFSRVIEQLDKEAVIVQFTAEDICEYADERELVDELISRGWNLVEDDE